MITGAINLFIWTVLIFFLGMYKPKWPLFFMEKPNRFLILAICTVLFMITATLYGEGLRREKLEKVALQPAAETVVHEPVPVPVPEVPKPANPAAK